jgi:hypothetical protein
MRRRKRRPLQFSLRTAFAVVAAISILLAAFVVWGRPAWARRQLQQLGATVVTEAGADGEYVSVYLDYLWQGGDKGLVHLRHIKNLKALCIANAVVTDESIGYIAQIESLKFLDTETSPLSSAAVERLRRMRPDLDVLTAESRQKQLIEFSDRDIEGLKTSLGISDEEIESLRASLKANNTGR